jgi:hypothetical protein
MIRRPGSKFEGRLVRSAGNNGQCTVRIGFLHWIGGRENLEEGWYVCPGWGLLQTGAQPLPESAVFDGRRGILLDGDLLYRWAGRRDTRCAVECPACVGTGSMGTFWCRFESGLQGVTPGRHQCVVDAATAATLVSEWTTRLERARREADKAAMEATRIACLVERLQSLS